MPLALRHALPALLTLSAACLLGEPPPPANPCEPNPCNQPNRSQCVAEQGQARCLCDPGFISRPSGACEPLSAANCPEHPGDSAEPDDCMARARLVSADNRPFTQSIDPAGDYDFLRVEGTRPRLYTVSVRPEGSLLPRVDVFDQAGLWLNAGDMGQRPPLAFTFKAYATAPYYLRVSHSPLDPSVGTGTYTLTLADAGPEDHGDVPGEATAIVADRLGSSQIPTYTGRLELARDADWFSFPAQAGFTYRLSFNPNALLPTVALFSRADTQRPFLVGRSSLLTFEVPAGGTTYIALYSPDHEVGPYNFTLLY